MERFSFTWKIIVLRDCWLQSWYTYNCFKVHGIVGFKTEQSQAA